MKIVTQYIHPPIPDRSHDWIAYDDDTHDIGSPEGYGRTEADAIADLLEQLDDAASGQAVRGLYSSLEDAEHQVALKDAPDLEAFRGKLDTLISTLKAMRS
jgi:hypothetical protein